MSSTELREYDINILRIDDLTLFKKCINEVSNGDELLILSGIVPKIFRQLIDLKLRIKGILFEDKIVEDIENMNLEEPIKKQLLTLNTKINRAFKKINKFDGNKSKEIISYLKSAVDLLGFNDFLSEDELRGLDTYNTEKNISDNLKSENILFEMVDAANDVIYRNLFPEIKNYISHPRQQITKQITSLSNDFLKNGAIEECLMFLYTNMIKVANLLYVIQKPVKVLLNCVMRNFYYKKWSLLEHRDIMDVLYMTQMKRFF